MVDVNGMWCEVYDLNDCIEIVANEYSYDLADKMNDFINDQIKEHEKEVNELRNEIWQLEQQLSEYEE